MGSRGLTGGIWAPRGSENGLFNFSINLSGLRSFSRLYIEEFSEDFLVSLSIESSINGGL